MRIFSNNFFYFVDKTENTVFLLECQNENAFNLTKNFNIEKRFHIYYSFQFCWN